jgi:hypothetical protein
LREQLAQCERRAETNDVCGVHYLDLA